MIDGGCEKEISQTQGGTASDPASDLGCVMVTSDITGETSTNEFMIGCDVGMRNKGGMM